MTTLTTPRAPDMPPAVQRIALAIVTVRNQPGAGTPLEALHA